MFLQRFFKGNPKAEAHPSRSSLENDETPTYTSNVTAAPNLPGRDSVRVPESSLMDTLGIAEAFQVPTANYIYYRIYADDGAILSKIPVAPSDPFLGRIKATSVPPPHTTKAVKRRIAKAEDIKDRISTSLFLTPYSQSPMGDADKIAILNRTGPGSTPQEPLALVAKMSDSERSALEFEGRGGLASAEEPESTPPEIGYLYYLLYADDDEMPSKVAIDPEKPSLGRIRADSVPPPHSPASIKRCISRVETTPALAQADLFADISCDTPLKEGYLSILHTDCPGLSPNRPLAIVQMPIVQVETPSIPDGTYVIKNRAADIYWTAGVSSITTVYFWLTRIAMKDVGHPYTQWNITHDANGNIFMESQFSPSSWVGAEITGSTVPVPWRLIPADGKFYYLTTDMNPVSQNPRVPAAQPLAGGSGSLNAPGSMATLKEGDQWQMWKFIRI